MKIFKLSGLLGFAMVAALGQTISLASFEDFEGGTTAGWAGGSAPTNVSGGVLGSGKALGLSAINRGLATFNTGSTWSGDYDSAGVTSVSGWFRNDGSGPLELRVVLHGTLGDRFTSSTSLVLAAGSGWTQKTFSLAEADLTQVLGANSYASVYGGVERLMFRHDSGVPDPGGESVTGAFRMDNIQAVPEPATMAAIAMGIATVANRKRKK